MGQNNTVRWTLDVSPVMDLKLSELSEAMHLSRSDVLIRAFALLTVAVEARVKGQKICIVSADGQTPTTEIIGL